MSQAPPEKIGEAFQQLASMLRSLNLRTEKIVLGTGILAEADKCLKIAAPLVAYLGKEVKGLRAEKAPLYAINFKADVWITSRAQLATFNNMREDSIFIHATKMYPLTPDQLARFFLNDDVATVFLNRFTVIARDYLDKVQFIARNTVETKPKIEKLISLLEQLPV